MILIVSQFLFTFLSNKRAGFIALCIGLILYFLLDVKTHDRTNFSKMIRRLALLVAGIYVLYRVSYYIDSTLGFGIYDRLNRISMDQGSGRSKMYSKVWQAICESDWMEVLFGHGMNTAGKVAGAGYAHNDYLEILYDYGVFPFVCIVIFVLLIICQAIQMIKRRSPYAPAFVLSVVIGITLSMFSYFLVFYTFVTCIMAFWGYAIKMEKLRLLKEEV
ncbi:MAG: O-antigen ligase family protein [Agathobacter sp.]|nr:O-antigen ligase family protein [Agathobacter sp.]